MQSLEKPLLYMIASLVVSKSTCGLNVNLGHQVSFKALCRQMPSQRVTVSDDSTSSRGPCDNEFRKFGIPPNNLTGKTQNQLDYSIGHTVARAQYI